ncbi:hypothetical protein Dimus_010650 [Dionaea muscipula]
MAKTKKSERNPPSKPAKAKSPKKPSEKVFKDIGEKPAGEVCTCLSEAQPVKKVVRSRKGKKATTEVVAVEEEEALTEVSVGGTQGSKAIASRTKSQRKTRSSKKDIISLAVGENEVEVEAEGNSEETQSDEDTQTERPAAVLIVCKQGQTRKKRQKQVARTGPAAKRAKTGKPL